MMGRWDKGDYIAHLTFMFIYFEDGLYSALQ